MDKINGGSHFRIDLDKFISLQKELISFNSGLEVPDFIIDSEIGKIPLRTDFVTKNEEGKYILTSFEKNKSIEY
jgi:L-lysine 2,3-aminomutase